MCCRCVSSPRCRSELIDSAWVVNVPGQKCTKKTRFNFGNDILGEALKKIRVTSRIVPVILFLYMFSASVIPATCIICLVVFQIWCHSYVKHVPHSVPIILIIISNDIHLNPGPHYQNNYLHYYIKRYSLKPWTSPSKQFSQLQIMEPELHYKPK